MQNFQGRHTTSHYQFTGCGGGTALLLARAHGREASIAEGALDAVCIFLVLVHLAGWVWALRCGFNTFNCIHHVVVLQEKNDVLIEYAKKGLAGGLLMALQAGADANHKDKV